MSRCNCHAIVGAAAVPFVGYAVGAGLMIAAAVVAAALGVRAERRSLEEIAEPLSAAPSSR